MSPRRIRRILSCLLPLLVLRALVPVGFMVDTSEGDLSLIVCPGHAPTERSNSSDDGANGKHADQYVTRVCSFAAASGAALAQHGFDPVLAVAPREVFEGRVDIESGPTLGPVRAQRSRAPPKFS